MLSTRNARCLSIKLNVRQPQYVQARNKSDDQESEEPSGFFKKMLNRFKGQKTSTEATADESKDLETSDIQYVQIEEMLTEQKEKELQDARLKSRLFYSDRALINNERPQAGISWEKYDEHTSRQFKARMLSNYGKSTGINPSVSWPTSNEIEIQKEYERVLYDGMSLREMIDSIEKKIKEDEEEIIRTEKEIKVNLAKQEADVAAWQKRVETRNSHAERERNKRQQILKELRKEYGYDVNPNDPQFAEKIAEKEKIMAKEAKEAKKQLKEKKLEEKKAAAAESTEVEEEKKQS